MIVMMVIWYGFNDNDDCESHWKKNKYPFDHRTVTVIEVWTQAKTRGDETGRDETRQDETRCLLGFCTTVFMWRGT